MVAQHKLNKDDFRTKTKGYEEYSNLGLLWHTQPAGNIKFSVQFLHFSLDC